MAERVDMKDLAARCRCWGTGDLVQATTVEASTYTPDELALLRKELESRPAAAPFGPEPPMFKSIGSDLRGVGGFLALMVLDIGLASVSTLFKAIRVLGQSPFVALINGSLAAYGVLVCWLLISIDRRAPRAAAIWYVLILILSLSVVAFSGLTRNLVVALGLAFVLAVYPIVWLSYLRFSDRVKITYGPARPQPAVETEVFD